MHKFQQSNQNQFEDWIFTMAYRFAILILSIGFFIPVAYFNPLPLLVFLYNVEPGHLVSQ
jgi:hypothetical protein